MRMRIAPHCRQASYRAVLALLLTVLALPAAAGFTGTDVFIPASARSAGVVPAQFYSTLWLTNLSLSTTANVTLKFFERDTSNTSPITVPMIVAPGQTQKLENVVQTVFGLPSASGAIRVQSDQEILATSRTYNLPPGSDIRDANGLFFAGVPRSLSIGPGQTTQLQGVSQGGAEDFRYNFGFVETAGAPVTVRIIVRNADGSLIATKDYTGQAYEAKQFAITDAAPGISAVNARIDASVISGSGSVLVYGTSTANGSQDSIGFEMSFPIALLSGGVTTLNGLSGAVSLAAGSNVTLTPSGNTITIASSGGGGGGGGVPSVNGITGAVNLLAGTNLSITPSGGNLTFAAGFTSLNGLTGAVSLAAGSNVTLTPSGSTITIGSSGGVPSVNGITGAVNLLAGTNITITPSGGNLTFAASPGAGFALPYTGSAPTSSSSGAFNVSTPGTSPSSSAIVGTVSSAGPGGFSTGVRGVNNGTGGLGIGVWGSQSGSGFGVYGTVSGAGYGVYGTAASGVGVIGSDSGNGNGVYGSSASGISVLGYSGASGYNPVNPADKNSGVWGDAAVSSGVLATTKGQFVGALRAQSMAATYGRGVEAYVTGANASAVYAVASSGATQAGYFQGNVQVTGSVSKAGGSFQIDHPLDPANRYLFHSFVESPDMMNIYNGNAVLDAKGEAVIELPDWFSALNQDYRYQLTCVGGFSPVYVASEIEGNSFRIGGGKAGLKVSWQVTGIRHDAWANAHRIQVEEMKVPAERGFYLHPTLYGQPEEKGLEWVRNREKAEEMKQWAESQPTHEK